MSSKLADLLAEMRQESALDKTALAPDEPTVNDSQQNSDPLAIANDIVVRIGNFLQAGQGPTASATVTPTTPQQGDNQAGLEDGTGGTSKVQLEIPQGMTIKVASDIVTREEAVRFLLAVMPEAFAE